MNLRSLLHSKVLTPLASLSFPIVEERTVTKQTRTILETRLVDTNTHFRSLQECIDWCNNKLVKQLTIYISISWLGYLFYICIYFIFIFAETVTGSRIWFRFA